MKRPEEAFVGNRRLGLLTASIAAASYRSTMLSSRERAPRMDYEGFPMQRRWLGREKRGLWGDAGSQGLYEAF